MYIGVSKLIPTQKILQVLRDKDIHTLQHGIFLEYFSDISRCGDNFHSPWVSDFPLFYFYSFSLLLLAISQ